MLVGGEEGTTQHQPGQRSYYLYSTFDSACQLFVKESAQTTLRPPRFILATENPFPSHHGARGQNELQVVRVTLERVCVEDD